MIFTAANLPLVSMFLQFWSSSDNFLTDILASDTPAFIVVVDQKEACKGFTK